MSEHPHRMQCPADMIELGDRIARSPEGPWAYVAGRTLSGRVVHLDVQVDHGNGLERETWRPLQGTPVHLEYQSVARIRDFPQRGLGQRPPVGGACQHCGQLLSQRAAVRVETEHGSYWAHIACEQRQALLEG